MNEFAGACYSRVVRASVYYQAREWPTTAGPTAATLSSIQTASRHPGLGTPWALWEGGAEPGTPARRTVHVPFLRRLDSVS